MAACTYGERGACISACGCGWCNSSVVPQCMVGDGAGPLGAPPGCTEWLIAGETLVPCERSDHLWLVVIVVLVFVLLGSAVVAWCARGRCTLRALRKAAVWATHRTRRRETLFGTQSVQLLSSGSGSVERGEDVGYGQRSDMLDQ